MKIAKDELLMLFGGSEESAVKTAFSYGVKIILVTDGAKGAELYMENAHIALPAEKVNTIDTTGAGDIFFGTFLSEWINNKSTAYNITPEMSEKYLKKQFMLQAKAPKIMEALHQYRILAGYNCQYLWNIMGYRAYC